MSVKITLPTAQPFISYTPATTGGITTMFSSKYKKNNAQFEYIFDFNLDVTGSCGIALQSEDINTKITNILYDNVNDIEPFTFVSASILGGFIRLQWTPAPPAARRFMVRIITG